MKKLWKVSLLGMALALSFTAYSAGMNDYCDGTQINLKNQNSQGIFSKQRGNGFSEDLQGLNNGGRMGRKSRGNKFNKAKALLSFDKIDKNGDGVIDKDEFKVCQNAMKKMGSALMKIRQIVTPGNKGNKGEIKKYILKKYDLNKNGKIDSEEKELIIKDKKELFSKCDVNNDGKLSKEERTEMFKEMRQELGIPEKTTKK